MTSDTAAVPAGTRSRTSSRQSTAFALAGRAGGGGAAAPSPFADEDEEEDEDDEDDEHLQAAAISVQQALLCYLPQALAVRNYALAAPRTCGWVLTYDGSRFLLGKDMKPEPLKLAAVAAGGIAAAPSAPSAAVSTSAATLSAVPPVVGESGSTAPGAHSLQNITPFVGLLQRLAAQAASTPYVIAFAYRFRRAISASSGITARFAFEYSLLTPLLTLPVTATAGRSGSGEEEVSSAKGPAAGASSSSSAPVAAGAAFEQAHGAVLCLTATTLEGLALASLLAQLAGRSEMQPPRVAGTAGGSGSGGVGGSGGPAGLLVDRFVLMEEPALRAPT
jgi:hypothetical protein